MLFCKTIYTQYSITDARALFDTVRTHLSSDEEVQAWLIKHQDILSNIQFEIPIKESILVGPWEVTRHNKTPVLNLFETRLINNTFVFILSQMNKPTMLCIPGSKRRMVNISIENTTNDFIAKYLELYRD